jgi:hypothetical protein
MLSDILYNLHSKGNLWLAERDGIRITASSLEELDSLISEHIRQEFSNHKGENLNIKMFFDQSEIPEWMRQYANHYFNRHIRITI